MLEFADENEIEDERILELNRLIDRHYLDMDQEELVGIGAGYDQVDVQMLQVISVFNTNVLVWDCMNDVDYPKMIFPPAIHPYLRADDVFLATFGMRGGKWYILALSPRYETFDASEEVH